MRRWLAAAGPLLWFWLRLVSLAATVSALVYLLVRWRLPGVLAWLAANVRLPFGQMIVGDVLDSVRQAGPLGFALAAFGWVIWARRFTSDRPRRGRVVFEVDGWAVRRPRELDEVVSALLSSRDATVGVTTALQGVGGFGKTVLARMVCTDARIRRRFAHASCG